VRLPLHSSCLFAGDGYTKNKEKKIMAEKKVQKYRCTICGAIVIPNPDGSCPVCGAPGDMLVPVDEDGNDIPQN
jgi:rRNA maturation endonuclease Nob1